MPKALEEHARWTEVIEPSPPPFDLRLPELWRYRDLVLLLIRRDFVANYKQTILGPLWFLLQPLLTSFTYLLIFGRAAGLGPKGVPLLLFYLSGTTVWSYFADCLLKTASVFRDNAAIFGKVYFPRLVMPVAVVLSNLMKFAVQIGLFLLCWCYYFFTGAVSAPSGWVFLTPVLIALMGLLGLGAGMIISALTTKYRDLMFLVGFGVQLLMFSTPVIIPLERIPERHRWLIHANPATSIVEAFRHIFVHTGELSWPGLAYSATVAVTLTVVGILIFNRVEKTFTDTV